MRLRVAALLAGVVNGAISGLLAALVGSWLAGGFTVDWIVHERQTSFDWEAVAGDAALTAFAAGAIVTLIAGAVAAGAVAKGRWRLAGEPRYLSKGTTTKGFFLLRWALILGLSLAGFLALNVSLWAAISGSQTVTDDQYLQIKVLAGVGAGFLAGYFATIAAAWNAHGGRIRPLDPELGNFVARISLASARNPKPVLLTVGIITLIALGGVAQIHTDVDIADVLPRGDPNTEAAHNLTSAFESGYTQQAQVQFTVSPAKWAADNARLPNRATEGNAENITDEVYVRALDEFFQFVREDSFTEYFIGLPTYVKLLNWTNAGTGGGNAPDEAWSIPSVDPAGERQYQIAWESAWAAIQDAITPIISPDFRTSVGLFLVPKGTEASSQQIGQAFIDARDRYLDWAETNARYKVFTGENRPLIGVELVTANAHSSELVQHDFRVLLPLIAYFIVASLYIAFRNGASILIASGALATSALWAYGLMGYLDIPLNPVNLTIVPLILGVGIDYAIHMVSEFQEHKADGLTDQEAFRVAGGRAGFAMLIATLTSVVGLVVMTVSPSLLLAQLGLLAAVAMVVMYLLTITFIPAAITQFAKTADMGKKFSPSVFMPALGRTVSRLRFPVAVLLILVSGFLFLSSQNLTTEEFGDPSKNYPEDDWLRGEHEEGLRRFYNRPEPDFKANVLVFEGDVTDPQSHRWIETIRGNLGTKEDVDTSTARNLPFLIETWNTVKGGTPQAPVEILRGELAGRGATQASSYPETREEVQAVLDEIFRSPFREFAALFVNYPDNEITLMTFSVRLGSFEQAQQSWDQVWEAVEASEAERPENFTVAFAGNTATNVLFVTKQVPWLTYMSIASFAAVVVLVFAFTRDFIATLTVGILMGLTTIWWLGILPYVDIGLAITLMLPMTFIFNIGSDYAVHMVWNIRKTGSAAETFATTGKSVLFSFITTVGAFAIFIFTEDQSVRKAMIATTIAIAVIFVTTILIIPIFYRVGRMRPRLEPGLVAGGRPVVGGAPAARILPAGHGGHGTRPREPATRAQPADRPAFRVTNPRKR